jgi:uncharacterized protein
MSRSTSKMNNVWLPFITGLTSGGLSCFAVQGGLLTSALTEDGTGNNKHIKERGLFMFLITKITVYTILGAALGAVGSAFTLSPIFQGWLQIFVGFYMLATTGRLLDLHPVFRYFVIQPPKNFLRIARNGSRAKTFFAPAILGALTILLPCGITQAMMLLAVSSGSGFLGASIMFFFILGTSPVFFFIGLAATTLLKNKTFSIIAAAFIFLMGVLSINSGQILRGNVHTLQNYWAAAFGSKVNVRQGNIVNIKVTSHGYTADVNTLKRGVPVKINLITDQTIGCSRAFTIPAFNISKILPATGTTTIEFTPTKLGQLTYTCSMGMYSGSFNVIE